MSLGILNLLSTGQKIPLTPRSNNSHIRSQSLNSQLETNLIVALAGSTVSNSVSAFLLSYINQMLSNQWTCKGGTQQILALIYSTSLQSRPYIILQELLSQIQNIALGSTGTQCLVVNSLHIIALANISTASNNLTATIIFLQPRDNNGGIQTTGISQYDFIKLCHNLQLLKYHSILCKCACGTCYQNLSAHSQGHNSLLGVETVFCFIKNNISIGLQNIISNFLASISWETVHNNNPLVSHL